MDGLVIILILILLGLLALPIISLSSSQNQSIKIQELKRQIEQLRSEVTMLRKERNDDVQEKKDEIPHSENLSEKEEIINTLTPEIHVKPVDIVNTTISITEPAIQSAGNILMETKDSVNNVSHSNNSKTSAEWEALIGGKVLNRIGALALIIGVGFFLKYAFDNNWITETIRVLIGFATGGLLLLGGYYYHKKEFHIFSQGLIGSGIAILYLSVYSSFNYYHLVSQITAFGLMSAITAISFWHALKYNSIAIALLGWLGGSLTPFLLSTGNANETGLFLYLALLNAGQVYISLRKEKWQIIQPLALGVTIIIYCAWNGTYFIPQMGWLTALFLFIFWIIFLIPELIRILNKNKTITWLEQGVSLANGAFFYIALSSAINPLYHEWLGTLTALLASIYLGIYLLIKKYKTRQPYLAIRHLLSVILLSICASMIQFEKFQIPIALAAESVILMAFANRYKNEVIYIASSVILGFSFFQFISVGDAFHIPHDSFHFLFNMRTLSLAAISLSAFGSGILANKQKYKFSQGINPAFSYTAILMLFIIITVETNDLFTQSGYNSGGDLRIFYWDNITWVLIPEWIFLSLPLFYYAIKKSGFHLLISGLLITTLALLFSLVLGFTKFNPINYFLPLLNVRSGALLILSASLWFQWNNIKKMKFRYSAALALAFRISIMVILFIFLTTDVRDIFEKKINHIYADSAATGVWNALSDVKYYEYLKQLCISGIWLVYSIILMLIGINRRKFDIRIASIILFGITIAKVFFYDLSALDTLHRIFSFISLGITLLLVSFLYHKYKHLILPRTPNERN